MASGVPVVANDVGSIGELVHDGRTGRVLNIDNYNVAVQQIMNLLNDRSTRNEMSRNGRAHATGNWSIRQTIEGYEKLITDIYESKCARTERVIQPTKPIEDLPQTAWPVYYSRKEA